MLALALHYCSTISVFARVYTSYMQCPPIQCSSGQGARRSAGGAWAGHALDSLSIQQGTGTPTSTCSVMLCDALCAVQVGESLTATLRVERSSGSRVSFHTQCSKAGSGEVVVEGTALALIKQAQQAQQAQQDVR